MVDTIVQHDCWRADLRNHTDFGGDAVYASAWRPLATKKLAAYDYLRPGGHRQPAILSLAGD